MQLFGQTTNQKRSNMTEGEYGTTAVIPIDMWEDDNFYSICAEIPGRDVSDIKVKFKGEKLSLKVNEEEESSDEHYSIISERCHDERERLIEFESPINKKSVKASYQNGLLSITIKKVDPEAEEDENLIKINA